MLSDVRGEEEIQDRELSLSLGLLLSKRMWVSILTANALQKKRVLNKMNTQGLSHHVPHSSSWHPGCFTTHAHVPPGHGGATKTPYTLWQPLHSDTEQGSGTTIRRGACRGEQQDPQAGLQDEVAAHLLGSLQAWEVQGCLQRCTSVHLFLICGCHRTAGVRRSEQVANSSNPAPGAAFGRVTLGAFAGSTAFGWLGSFLWLWSKGLSLLHPHSLYEQRHCFKPGVSFAVVLLLWASL